MQLPLSIESNITMIEHVDNDVKSAARGYDPVKRAAEKQASRDQDEADLASGAKTREQLRRENGLLFGFGWRVKLAEAKSLS